MLRECELAIIGGGPAALTMAIYAATERLKAQVLLQGPAGGQIVQSPLVENVPGMGPHGSTGRAYIRGLLYQCAAFPDCHLIKSRSGAQRLLPHGDKWVLHYDTGMLIAKAVCLAVGSTWVIHPIFHDVIWPEHIYYGPFHTPHVPVGDYVVLGGGNSAAQGILKLAARECHVTVLCRHDLDCSQILIDRINEHATKGRVEVLRQTVCEKVECNLEEQRYVVHATGDKQFSVSGIFCMIGQQPSTDWLKDSHIELDEHGYIKVNDRYETNSSGVFAAGDCRSSAARHNVVDALGSAGACFNNIWSYLRDRQAGRSVS